MNSAQTSFGADQGKIKLQWILREIASSVNVHPPGSSELDQRHALTGIPDAGCTGETVVGLDSQAESGLHSAFCKMRTALR